jgi:hypothetical protein
MPHGKLTTNNFAARNYFLFLGIEIPLVWGHMAAFNFEKIHSG